MAKKATKPKPSQSAAVDMERLSQAQASWLISKPAVWLRDNSHLDGRSPDGSYNAKQLVRAVRSDFTSTELPDGDLEPVLQLAETFAETHGSAPTAVIRILEGINQRYGAAGMAAIAEAFLAELRWCLQRYGESQDSQKPKAEEIQAEADVKIAALSEWDARHEMRTVLQCVECGKYRWGRRWKEPPFPNGYAIIEGLACPECE